MLKLLKGSFIRLFNSNEFQITPFILIIANIAMIAMQRLAIGDVEELPGLPEFNAVFHVVFIGVCISVFTALFIGTEFSNATVFNKIIFGHSRAAVYFTYLLTCLFAAAFVHLTATAATFFIGWAILGKPLFTVGTMALHYLLSLPPVFAVTSLHLTLSLTLQNRALSTGISSAVSTIFLYAAMYFCNDENLTNELFDLLPDFYLQKLAMREMFFDHEAINFPLYPCLLFIAFTVAGFIIFSNINIKNTPEGEI